MSGHKNDGKRPRDEDEDLGAQQSILKWMRHVPGPLQDVMKKQADQLDESQGHFRRIVNANSDRFSVAITTVFDQGPWVEMCQYLGMPAVSGSLYGSIEIPSLKYTVQGTAEDDQALAKVPSLLVLIKSVRYVEEEIVAVLHDPTGEIEGYFHRELVERLGPTLVAGVGILLYKVSVFTPTEAPVGGVRKSYLNITPRNVRRVFVAESSIKVETVEDSVKVFNEKKEVESQHESDNDDYDNNEASRSEQAACQILHHSSIRDTSAELTFLSQRQVIHRNPPVRAEVTTSSNKKSKRGKGATARNHQEQESGLGKWQWSKLLKKTKGDSSDDLDTDSRRTQERRGFLDASSRLVDLITKKNAENRASDDGLKEDSAASTAKKSASVRFAVETVVDPPATACSSGNDKVDHTQSNLSSQHPGQECDSDTSKEDDDDDW